MKKILALECATTACSVALNLDGNCEQLMVIKPRIHNRIVLPMMDRLLGKAGLRPRDLDLVVCGIGPGAFMGVRIAVAVAQGLASAADLPLIGISSLYALAEKAWQETAEKKRIRSILPLLDARLGEVYWAHYGIADGQVNELVPPTLSPPEKVNPVLLPLCVGVGEGWKYQQQLPHSLKELQYDINAKPEARHLIDVARKQAPSLIHEPHQLEPLYLRNQVAGRF